jgi:hypothetical protein
MIFHQAEGVTGLEIFCVAQDNAELAGRFFDTIEEIAFS